MQQSAQAEPLLSEYFRVFPGISDYFRVFPSISELSQNFRVFPTGLRGIVEHFRVFPGGTQGYTGGHRPVQQSAQAEPLVSEYFRVFPSFSEFFRVFPSISEHFRVFLSISHRIEGYCRAFPMIAGGYTGGHWGTQRCSEAHRQNPLFPSISEFIRVFPSLSEYFRAFPCISENI